MNAPRKVVVFVSRLLVVATGPLFSPEVRMLNGQALRGWHFVRPLRDAGHAVDLVILPTEGHKEEPLSGSLVQPVKRDGLLIQLIQTTHPDRARGALQDLFDRKPYDAVIAVNLNAAALACRLRSHKPLWADLYGYTMGEAQTKCHVHGSDEWLRHFWVRLRQVLRRADAISAVSLRQKHATLAEMATLGRMNRHTFNYRFATVIPSAVSEELLPPDQRPSLSGQTFSDPSDPNADTKPAPVRRENRYRGVAVPRDAFLLLWSGGFNTWTDVSTLAGALSLAMEQSPNLRFLCTGGAIPGHDEISFRRFQELMRQSGYSDRCHFLGWVETAELDALHRECDLAINIDCFNYETYFGARTRLTQWMGLGVPIITTLGTEISEIIQDQSLGYAVRAGDIVELADALLRAEREPAERRLQAARARAFALEHFSYDATTRVLLGWAEHPTLAPDNEIRRQLGKPGQLLQDIPINELDEESAGLETNLHKTVRHLQAELDGIRSHPLYKFYKTFQDFFKR